MTTKWPDSHLVALDTETTGPNPLNDRIVTAAIVHTQPGRRPLSIQWLIQPGIPIEPEAAEIHGWTQQRLDDTLAGAEAVRIANGETRPLTRDGALFEIAAQAATAMHAGAPLVVHNAAFDLTLLETELTHAGIDTLSSRPDGIRGVVDPMVIEKQFDPFRKVKNGCKGGKVRCNGCGMTDKKLTSLCAHYGVTHTGAHDAAADALAAIRLTHRLVAAWPQIGTWKLGTLHQHQVGWRAEQSDSLRSFWRKSDDIRWSEVDSGWPLHSACTPGLVGVGS